MHRPRTATRAAVAPTSFKDLIWRTPASEAWWSTATDREILDTTTALCVAEHAHWTARYQAGSPDVRKGMDRDLERSIEHHALPKDQVQPYACMGQYQTRQWCDYLVQRGGPDGTINTTELDDVLTHMACDCWARGSTMDVRAVYGIPQRYALGRVRYGDRGLEIGGRPMTAMERTWFDTKMLTGFSKQAVSAVRAGRVADDDVLRMLTVDDTLLARIPEVAVRVASSWTQDAGCVAQAIHRPSDVKVLASDPALWETMPTDWRAEQMRNAMMHDDMMRAVWSAWTAQHMDKKDACHVIGLQETEAATDARGKPHSRWMTCARDQSERFAPIMKRLGREPAIVRDAVANGMASRMITSCLSPMGRAAIKTIGRHAMETIAMQIGFMEADAVDGDVASRMRVVRNVMTQRLMQPVQRGDLDACVLAQTILKTDDIVGMRQADANADDAWIGILTACRVAWQPLDASDQNGICGNGIWEMPMDLTVMAQRIGAEPVDRRVATISAMTTCCVNGCLRERSDPSKSEVAFRALHRHVRLIESSAADGDMEARMNEVHNAVSAQIMPKIMEGDAHAQRVMGFYAYGA